eukprot:scaffold146216_cov31-Tisochrysis_lutea.AAC.3
MEAGVRTAVAVASVAPSSNRPVELVHRHSAKRKQPTSSAASLCCKPDVAGKRAMVVATRRPCACRGFRRCGGRAPQDTSCCSPIEPSTGSQLAPSGDRCHCAAKFVTERLNSSESSMVRQDPRHVSPTSRATRVSSPSSLSDACIPSTPASTSATVSGSVRVASASAPERGCVMAVMASVSATSDTVSLSVCKSGDGARCLIASGASSAASKAPSGSSSSALMSSVMPSETLALHSLADLALTDRAGIWGTSVSLAPGRALTVCTSEASASASSAAPSAEPEATPASPRPDSPVFAAVASPFAACA